MSDIMERLRDTVQILATTQMNLSMEDWDKVSNAILDAAGAIKRLRDDNGELTRRKTEAASEIERLRAALKMFACCCADEHLCSVPDNCRNYLALAALEERT